VSEAGHGHADAARRSGPGFFTTRAVWTDARGELRRWESRRARKSSPRLNPHKQGTLAGSFWHPRAMSWWIGVLFMIGSACFAVPSVTHFADAMGAEAAAITYFIGSIFFTSAGYLQFFESVNAAREAAWAGADHTRRVQSGRAGRPRLVPFGWQPRHVDYWATLIQFVGTLYFNGTTFHALDLSLQGSQYDTAVWRPDAWGSLCFLVASYLALAEVCHSFWRFRGSGVGWWIAALNMIGSIAFGVSAVGAYEAVPGQYLNFTLARVGTLVGAVCFFIGATLLLPEAGREEVSPAPAALTAGDATS
jgi:hypothetical protein